MDYERWELAASGPVRDEDFYALSPEAADALARRFDAESGARAVALESFVRLTPGLEGFVAECTPEALRELAQWLSGVLVLGDPRPGRIEILNPGLPESIRRDLSEANWGERRGYANPVLARSIALDLGCLIARGLHRVAPDLQWKPITDRDDIDENKPALIGTWVRFCPYVQPFNVISRIVRGEDGPERLWELFELNREEALRAPPKENTPIPQRRGQPSGSRCPRCGMSFGRVRTDQGHYCNHCGHLDAAE